MKNKNRQKHRYQSSLPADSAARLPDTQLPASLVNPQSDNAVAQAKRWVDEHKM